MIKTNKETAASISVDITNFGNNLSSQDNTVQKALETLDNLSSGGGDPVYYPIGTVQENEIRLIVRDGTVDSLDGFTVTTTTGGEYNVEIYGANEALLHTWYGTSGSSFYWNIPSGGAGYSSGTGFTSYMVKITTDSPTDYITSFTHNSNYKYCLIKAHLGTTELTSMANCFKDCYNLIEVVLPSTMASLTTMGGSSSAGTFLNCYNLATLTLPTSAANLTDISYAFYNCYSLTEIAISSNATGITTLEGAFYNCYSLTTITLPTTLASCTTLSNAFANCRSLTSISLPETMNALTTISGAFTSCYSLTSLTLPTSMTALTGSFASTLLHCYTLTTLSECANWGTNQLSISTNTRLKALTTFDQSALRVAKLDLQGSSAVPNGLTYIDIDYANSTYGGTAPQLDFDYCSLEETELNRIFTALPTAAKTISIIGNPGTATCDTSIATAKTWTVITA